MLAAEEDFTSVLFPFLAHADRGVRVQTVPLDRLVEAIGPGVDLVAVSAVQSADGRIVPGGLDGLASAAAGHGCLTYVDATQAVGWLPFDADRFDFVSCAAYKWLLSPRGTAFGVVRPERLAMLRPLYAGWYAGDDPWTSIYGPPLRLARDARRLDISPAWLSWAGTVPALDLLDEVGIATIHRHDLGARERAARTARPATRATRPIVTVAAAGGLERLRAAEHQGLRPRGRRARVLPPAQHRTPTSTPWLAPSAADWSLPFDVARGSDPDVATLRAAPGTRPRPLRARRRGAFAVVKTEMPTRSASGVAGSGSTFSSKIETWMSGGVTEAS